jgi:single-strand DNA-binding protein
MSINSVTITGNLTRDIELRQTQGGYSIGSICVAVNDRRRNSQTEEWEDKPNFIDCTLFGNRADGLAPYLNKGQKVAINGKLDWQQWETQDGQKRSKVGVIVNDLELLGGGKQQGQQQGQTQQATIEDDVADEDFPF